MLGLHSACYAVFAAIVTHLSWIPASSGRLANVQLLLCRRPLSVEGRKTMFTSGLNWLLESLRQPQNEPIAAASRVLAPALLRDARSPPPTQHRETKANWMRIQKSDVRLTGGGRPHAACGSEGLLEAWAVGLIREQPCSRRSQAEGRV